MWYQEREEGILLFIKVIPGSSKNAIVGVHGDFLKVKITAPPEKGRANEVLCKFLARKFRVPKSGVKIVKGKAQPIKIVFVPVNIEKALDIVTRGASSQP